MKRILNCFASDFAQAPTRDSLKQAISDSQGRVVIAENAAEAPEYVSGISNTEITAGSGADMLLLKKLNVFSPKVTNVTPASGENMIQAVKKLTGRLVGANLIVNDEVSGVTANHDAIEKLIEMQPDFIGITGYYDPQIVTQERVLAAIREVRKNYDGLILLNRYYALDTVNKMTEFNEIAEVIDAGVDLIYLPAPGTIPGVSEELLRQTAIRIREHGGLSAVTFSTSQEGADVDSIREMALASKRGFVDAYEFGDADSGGMASPENIFALSVAVRGKRHTYQRIFGSLNR